MRLGKLIQELECLRGFVGDNARVMSAEATGQLLGSRKFGAVSIIKKVREDTVYLEDKDRLPLYSKDGKRRTETVVVIQ